MKKIISIIAIFINTWHYELLDKIYCSKMKRKYPDWRDDEYNLGNLKFIWGFKAVYGGEDDA